MTETQINQTISANLRKLRTNTFKVKGKKKKALTQTDVGKYMNCTFQQIKKKKKGQNVLTGAKLYKLSEFFQIPIGRWFIPIEQFNREITDEAISNVVLDN